MKNLHQNIIIKITIIFFVILILIIIIMKLYNLTNKTKIQEKQIKELFSKIEKNHIANVTKYYIYGTHFNIEGNIDIASILGIRIESVNLILKNPDGAELRNKSKLRLSGKHSFF